MSSNINRTKPVSASSAQSNKLCGVPSTVVLDRTSFDRQLELIHSEDVTLFIVVSLLIKCGLRVSEVLRIKPSDVSNSFMIKIRGSKGSNDRLVDASFLPLYIKNNRLVYIFNISCLSRYCVYRVMRKYGISLTFGDNINSSVTHVGRHLFALDAKQVTDSLSDIGNALGHVNNNNAAHYVKNQKKANRC